MTNDQAPMTKIHGCRCRLVIRHWSLVICVFLSSYAGSRCTAQDNLAAKQEKAVAAAVARVAPSVVRIETVGGLESVGNVFFGTGPTTGLVVSDDGYIVTSAFNFAQKPSQILVYLDEAEPVPAELVCTDFNRRTVLLKVKTSKPLAVPEAAPQKSIQIGQWSIALGRAFGDGKKLNLSVGIISAVNRIWSKAVQTDAKISPANYGGPLVDIHGRVIGLLVPLAQDGPGGAGAASEVAGVEWYDSGIGFAVPLEHINGMLERMKKEKELQPGKIGVMFKSGDIYSGEVVIASAPVGSPAQQAGFKAGDKIVELDGVKISRQAELRHALMPRYAGDKVKLVAMRGQERIERELELVAQLAPYNYPFLGILPQRGPEANDGVAIRYVYPKSPAAGADLQPNDRIVAIDGKPASNRNALAELIAAEAAGLDVEIEFRRGEETKRAKVKLGTMPEEVPGELPPAHGEIAPAEGEKQATGLVSIKIPEAANECFAYVPESYNANVPHGILLWLHAPGGYKEDELAAAWKDHCAKHDLILLAPKSSDVLKWQRSELEFVRKALDDLASKYNIDRRRIVVAGAEGGGAMAYLFAFANREFAQGVAAIDAPLPSGTSIPPTDAVQRQAFFITTAKKAPAALQIQTTIQQLRAANYPVTVKDLGESSRQLTGEENAELARWIDALDRQ
jgi:serine protease Do